MWVSVEPASGTTKKLLRASSMPFWIAAGHFLRLAVAEPDIAVAVADDDERGEREPPSTLDDLGDAVDRDHSLVVLTFSIRTQSLRESIRLRGRHRRPPRPGRGT